MKGLWKKLWGQNALKMGPSGQAPTFHTYEITQIPFHTHAGRSKVFKNWDGSDRRVVPQPTNPSKFRRDFASGKSHSAPLPPLSSFPFIFGVSKHPHAFIPFHSYSCILFIHPFIGWPGPFRFCTFILENPIKIWNFFWGRTRCLVIPSYE